MATPEELKALAKDWDDRIRPLVVAECAGAAEDLRVFAIKIVREHQTRIFAAGEPVHLDVFIAEGAKWRSQFVGDTEERAPYLAIDLTPDGKIQVTGHGCRIGHHDPITIEVLMDEEVEELIDSFANAVIPT